jgi:hypothetical protein
LDEIIERLEECVGRETAGGRGQRATDGEQWQWLAVVSLRLRGEERLSNLPLTAFSFSIFVVLNSRLILYNKGTTVPTPNECARGAFQSVSVVPFNTSITYIALNEYPIL